MTEADGAQPFDRVAAVYDRTRGGEERGRRTALAISGQLVDGPSLELGVGTGVVAGALRAAGFRVIGCDLSGPMLRHARGRVGPVLHRADARRLPLRSGRLPNVYCVWLLHVVGDLVAAVREAARVLFPGGRFVVVCSQPERVQPCDVTEQTDRIWATLRPHGRADRPDRVVQAAHLAGLAPLAEGWVRSGRYDVSPARALEEIAGRVHSVLWEVAAEDWRSSVQPVVAALQRLPDTTRERAVEDRHRMLVFERR